MVGNAVTSVGDVTTAPGIGAIPSWLVFRPQQKKLPADVLAHDAYAPTPIWVLVVPSEVSSMGVALFVVDPSPSWPYVLSPQQKTLPVSWRAHTCDGPTSMRSMFVSDAIDAAELLDVVVPSPNWPLEFSPQHQTSPEVSMAQANAEPTATRGPGIVCVRGSALPALGAARALIEIIKTRNVRFKKRCI